MTYDPLAETRDSPVEYPAEWAALPLREREKMRRLHVWLEKTLWSPGLGSHNNVGWGDGICVLAGIDPEASDDAAPAGWALLPGLTPPAGWAEREELRVLVEDRVALIAGLRLPTAPPGDWIAAVARIGLAPPWAAAVLDSSVLRKTLPTKARTALREALNLPAEDDPRARGGHARLPDTRPNAKATAEALWKRGKSSEEIAAKLAGEGFSSSRVRESPYSPRTVRNWIKEFRSRE